jgi:hypothetical protein
LDVIFVDSIPKSIGTFLPFPRRKFCKIWRLLFQSWHSSYTTKFLPFFPFMDAKEVFETINEAMDFLLSFTLMLFDLKKNI